MTVHRSLLSLLPMGPTITMKVLKVSPMDKYFLPVLILLPNTKLYPPKSLKHKTMHTKAWVHKLSTHSEYVALNLVFSASVYELCHIQVACPLPPAQVC